MFQDLVWSDPCLFLSCAPYLSEALVFFFLMCHVDIQFKDPVVAAPVPKTPSSQISNWLALLECQGSSHLGPPHRRLPGLPKLKYIHLLVTFYHCYTFFHFFVCLTLSPSNYNHHRGRAFILFTTMSSVPNITWHTIITKCCELMNVSSLPRKLLVPHHCHQSGHLYKGGGKVQYLGLWALEPDCVAWDLALQLISWAILGRWSNSSMPQFSGTNVIFLTSWLGELNKKIHVKHLEQSLTYTKPPRKNRSRYIRILLVAIKTNLSQLRRQRGIYCIGIGVFHSVQKQKCIWVSGRSWNWRVESCQ